MAGRHPNERKGSPPGELIPGFPLFYHKKRHLRVVTGNLWAYLRHLNQTQLGAPARERSDAFVDQASEFFEAATNPKVRSRPLLYYYAFLNLAKVLLLHKKVALPNKVSHGIADPKTNSNASSMASQQVVAENQTTAANEYKLFAGLFQALDPSNTPAGTYKIVDLLEEIPAIHRTYEITAEEAALFVPAKRFEVWQDRNSLWGRLVIGCSNERTRKAVTNLSRQANFSAVFTRVATAQTNEPVAVFETSSRPYKGAAFEAQVAFLSEEIRAVGLWAIATTDGYRYCLASRKRPQIIPQLLSLYATMFYLGSVTRYRPHDYAAVVDSHQWLIDDFLHTQPMQYLHLISSAIAGTEVLQPLALSR